jgi:hypothetical protein
MLESYRSVTELSPGIETEINWYVNNMDLLIRDMGEGCNMALLEEAYGHAKIFEEIPITDEQVTIIGYIFKSILDPRSLQYIGISGIINLIALGYTLLWTRGHHRMAIMLLSKGVPNNDNDIDINATPNVRLDVELKARLAELYPYSKQLNATKTESVIESAIAELTHVIFNRRWVPNAPKYCLDEVFKDTPPRSLTPDFKNDLMRLIIDIEERAINAKQ